MNWPSLKAGAITVVLLTGAAWFTVSNHCALAVFAPTVEALAVHAHCHGVGSEPTKKNTDEEVPCCKVLRATIAASVEIPPYSETGIQDFVTTELFSIAEDHLQPLPEEIDTGPPFASSYAELILQRSILVHAPPFIV